MATPQQELIELYQNLSTKYKVTTSYTVGLGHNLDNLTDLSSDTITLIKHISQGADLARDMDAKSYLKIILTDKISGDYIATFDQNTDSYMEVFDMDELVDFLKEYNELVKTAEEKGEELEEDASESGLDNFYE